MLSGGAAVSLILSLIAHAGVVTALLVASSWFEPTVQHERPPREPIAIDLLFEQPAVRLAVPLPPELPRPDPLPVVPLVAMEHFEPPPVEELPPEPPLPASDTEPVVAEDAMPELPSEETLTSDHTAETAPVAKETVMAATTREASPPVAAPSPPSAPPSPPPATTLPPRQPAPRPDGGVKVGVKVLRWQDPTYPASCRRRGEQGLVRLEVEVRADGSVGRITVLQHAESPKLAEAAIAAIRQAAFAPATLDGQPIDALVVIPVRFQLK